jgi:hypothetical protein
MNRLLGNRFISLPSSDSLHYFSYFTFFHDVTLPYVMEAQNDKGIEFLRQTLQQANAQVR